MGKKILLCGESWQTYTVHTKGFDSFYTAAYEEGAGRLIAALEEAGHEVTYLPGHETAFRFPFTVEELNAYDCVILSDVGSNTLLLHPDTFTKSQRMPNRCAVIRDYVKQGGSLLMVGGYMTFAGIEGKAKYGRTPVAEVLPVTCLDGDDLVERPEGAKPVLASAHPALKDVPDNWPHFLGYNRTLKKEGCTVALTIGGDPLVAFGEFGRGRSAAFTSDCAPHWGPPEFVNWEGYTPLFAGVVAWLTEHRT